MVVRPRQIQAHSGGQRLGAAVAWLAASALYSLRFDGFTRLVVVCLALAVGACVFGAMALARRRTAIADVDGRLVFSGLFGDVVLPSATPGTRVVRTEVIWGGASGRHSRLWLLVRPTGRVARGLNLAVWDAHELEALRERLGLNLEVDDFAKRPAELRKAWPGSIPWWAAHPLVAAVLAVVVVSALVAAS